MEKIFMEGSSKFTKLAAKAEDADTWYLKAGCTLPAGQNLTVEAEVTGTDYSPQVIYFIVY